MKRKRQSTTSRTGEGAVRLILLAGGLCGPSAAAAQNVTTTPKPTADEQAIASGEKLAEEHLAGDWGGLRSRLLDRGVDLVASYESETAAVVSGGKRHGIDYAHDITLQADIDLAQLAGITGFSTHVALAERAGRNASADFLDEDLTQVQEIYGSGGDVAAHLSYLYGEEKLLGGRLDLEGGRMDVGHDFATSPLYCAFMTLSICPSPRSLSIESGFTIFPTATWGGRARGQFSPALYLQVGAYQARPKGGGRSGFDWSGSGATGAFFPAGIGYEPRLGPSGLIGHYKVGLTYDTSRQTDLAPVVTGVPGKRRAQASFYALADQMIVRTGRNGTDGVIVLGGYTHEDPRTTAIEQLAFVGLLASGVVPGRSKDSVGVQVTWLKVSGDLTTMQELETDAGRPLSSGLGPPANAPAGLQSHEAILEGRYGIAVATGVYLMPEVQYVVRPNAKTRYPDAVVGALRVSLDF